MKDEHRVPSDIGELHLIWLRVAVLLKHVTQRLDHNNLKVHFMRL